MKSFEYTIKDENGLHARPVGMIVNEAKKYASQITIACGEKKAAATKLMAIMSMGVKQGNTVTITVEGEDEEVAAKAMEDFFTANL